MKTKIIQNIKSFILVLILVLGVSYAYANFTAPTQAPPGCPAGSPGCDAPVNVSATAQAKSGSLTIGGSTVPSASYKLNVPGLASFTGIVTQALTVTSNLTITNNAGTDKVLMSDSTGNATWQTPGIVTPAEAQAIPAYGIETVEGTYGYNVAFICRTKISDGSVDCFKAKGSPINSLLTNWVGIGTQVFSATTLGSYDLSCSPGRASYNKPFCCRIDKMNGDVQCKYAKDTKLTNWVATTDADFPDPD